MSRRAGTLVLFHAFPLNARMWEPQLALAGSGWRILAPQLPGMDGGHEPPLESFDQLAADAEAWLDGLALDRPIIGGLSMGGYVTLELVRRAPARFAGMVLADTRADADSPEARKGRMAMLEALRTGGVAAVVDSMVPRLLSEETRTHRPAVVARVRELALASAPEAVAGAIRALMTRADSTPLLAQIACPTLVVVGEHDVITPPAVAEALRHAIPNAELVTIQRAGHLSNLEQPAAFNDAMLRFLTQLGS